MTMCRSAEAFESKDKTLSSLARFQQVLCCSFFLLSSITNSLPSIYVVLLREELEGGRGVSDGQEEETHLLEARQAGEGLVLALEGLGRPAHVLLLDFLQQMFNLHGAGGSLEHLLVFHLVLEKHGNGGL